MSYKRFNSTVIGFVLLLIGVLLLIARYTTIKITFWPLALILPGLMFLIFEIRKKSQVKNIFVPTILLLLGLYFYIEVLTGWKYSDKSWPVYVLIVTFGFYADYFIGNNKRSIKIANLMLVISIILFAIAFTVIDIWPIILIVAGGYLIFFNKKIFYNQTNEDNEDKEVKY
jgi:predicted membrane protein